jgi:hypothetical protein
MTVLTIAFDKEVYAALVRLAGTETRKPAGQAAFMIANELRARGLLDVEPIGPQSATIICPECGKPLTLTAASARM